MDAQNEALARLFMPHLMSSMDGVKKNNGRFVHYTSAQTAMSIISRRCVWLRNTMFMNDFSEIDYGVERVIGYFKSESAQPFWTLVEEVTGRPSVEIKELFDGWLFDLRTQTYVMCLSEHDKEEDEHGRLSMWRGYGTDTRVALVINPTAMLSETDVLGAYSYPIIYRDSDALNDLFNSITSDLVKNKVLLAETDQQILFNYVFMLLHSLPVSLKHPGFKEEREWRVVHQPNFSPSQRLRAKIEAVGGFPQKIFELPLEDVPEEGLVGVSPDKLVDRIIIGPTEHGLAMFHAFVELLREAGVSDPEKKVFCSGIPFRAGR